MPIEAWQCSALWIRGKFRYQGGRIETMNNTTWQRARREAGIPDLHIHDLRHTVGMRSREAEVWEETTADILWHTRPGMTAHYSEAQVDELVKAPNSSRMSALEPTEGLR